MNDPIPIHRVARACVLLALLTVGTAIPGAGAAGSGMFDRWSSMCEMPCAGYNRPEPLTNFPVLVTLGPHLDGFSYSQFKSPPHADLRFTDNTRTNELAYEIDTWNVSGSSHVWVRLPALTNNATIRAFWGREALSAPAYTTNGAVWTNRYHLVAHDGGGRDSSRRFSNAAIGPGTQPDNTNGAIGNATYFKGVATNVFDWGAISTLDGATQASVSMWLQPEPAAAGTLCARLRPNGTTGWRLYFGGNQARFTPSGYATELTSSSTLAPTGQLSLITLVFKGGQSMEFYRNGTLDSSLVTNTVVGTVGVGDTTFCVGAKNDYYATPPYNQWFNGTIDEFRISRNSFSSNWVWASWMNQASNTSFIAYGRVKPPNPLGTVILFR